MVHGDYEVNNLQYQELKNIQKCEKNWVYFADTSDGKNELKVVYYWYPLVIGKISENAFKMTEKKSMPLLFANVRGSTCGFAYKDEIWFVTHMVSHEVPRHYYHLVVVFDKKMNLLRYTAPFKFEGQAIEYCLGLVVEDERVIMTYSTWDRTSIVSVYDKKYIESKMKVK